MIIAQRNRLVIYMIKGIKGVKDLLPEETPRWRFIEEAARRWGGRYGFHEIRIPIFEVTTLFARSIGASTDIVEKEMYTFQDRDGTSLTLRPEGTAGTVRAYIEHNRAASRFLRSISISGPCSVTSVPKPVGSVNFISLVWSHLE